MGICKMLLNRFLQSGLTEICPSNYGFLEKLKKEKNFEPQIAHLTQIDSPDTHFGLKPVLPITVEFPSTIFGTEIRTFNHTFTLAITDPRI